MKYRLPFLIPFWEKRLRELEHARISMLRGPRRDGLDAEYKAVMVKIGFSREVKS